MDCMKKIFRWTVVEVMKVIMKITLIFIKSQEGKVEVNGSLLAYT